MRRGIAKVDLLLIAGIVGVVSVLGWPMVAGDSSDNGRSCLMTLKQVGMATFIYAGDNEDRLPLSRNWTDAIQPYLNASFRCPEAPGFGYSYAGSLGGKQLSTIKPRRLPMVYDADVVQKNVADAPLPKPPRHKGKNNVVYADGLAASLNRR